MRAGGQPGVQRDPSGVAAHHLDEHHPLMRLRGAVQPVDGLGGDLQRRVVAERDVGAVDVVVDGLRNADHRDVLLRQPVRRRQRALAADRDQHVDAVVLQRLLDLVEAGAQLVGVDASGAQHGAALGEQPIVAVVVGQLDAPVLEQTAPAVEEPDDRRAVPDVGRPHDGPDHGIQARTVAAAGEHSDPHLLILPCQTAVGSGPRAAS